MINFRTISASSPDVVQRDAANNGEWPRGSWTGEQDGKAGCRFGWRLISDFHLSDLAVNPLTWDSKGKDPEPRPMGHFLCLDRWGAPSPAEEKNGMPYHGEYAGHVACAESWKVGSGDDCVSAYGWS